MAISEGELNQEIKDLQDDIKNNPYGDYNMILKDELKYCKEIRRLRNGIKRAIKDIIEDSLKPVVSNDLIVKKLDRLIK